MLAFFWVLICIAVYIDAPSVFFSKKIGLRILLSNVYLKRRASVV